MDIRNQSPIPPSRPLEEPSPALPEEDANQRNNSVQSHLQPELDGGVEVEMAEKPPLQEDATIPFDVVSTAHLVDLQCMTTLMETSQIHPLYPPHACMYILVTKPVPVSVQLQTQK